MIKKMTLIRFLARFIIIFCFLIAGILFITRLHNAAIAYQARMHKSVQK